MSASPLINGPIQQRPRFCFTRCRERFFTLYGRIIWISYKSINPGNFWSFSRAHAMMMGKESFTSSTPPPPPWGWLRETLQSLSANQILSTLIEIVFQMLQINLPLNLLFLLHSLASFCGTSGFNHFYFQLNINVSPLKCKYNFLNFTWNLPRCFHLTSGWHPTYSSCCFFPNYRWNYCQTLNLQASVPSVPPFNLKAYSTASTAEAASSLYLWGSKVIDELLTGEAGAPQRKQQRCS